MIRRRRHHSVAGTVAALSAVAVIAAAPGAPGAQAASMADLPLVGHWFAPSQQQLSMSEGELASLGCLTFSVGAVATTVILGGAAAAATGGAATAVATAVPVLMGVAAAGCAFGATATPGLAWLGRNGDQLAQRIGDSLPALPVLPSPGELAR